MTHTFEARQFLPHPIQQVFAFFSNPENLPRLMPAWQKARIEDATLAPPPPRPAGTPVYPGTVAGPGTRMTLTFRALPLVPVRLPWDAEIPEFVWNSHFCDIQLARGPFKHWRHCHRLTPATHNGQPDGDPGTLLTDHVEYELPFGSLGTVVSRTLLPLQFRYLFRVRHRLAAQLVPTLRPLPVTSLRPA